MNICFVNDDFGVGGVQNSVAKIGNRIADQHNVTYVSLKKEKIEMDIPSEKITFFDRKLNRFCKLYRNFVKYSQYILFKNYDFSKYKSAEVKFLIDYIIQNDIEIVIMNQGSTIALIDRIQSKVPKVKFISWVHSNFEVYLNNYYRRFSKSLVKGIECSDQVICLTNTDKQNISFYSNNVNQIDNPNTLENPKISDLNNKSIAFVSRLNFITKGIDYLIEIAKNLPSEWKIKIAGVGTELEKKKLIEMIQINKLESRIIYCGEMNKSQLIEFYSSCSIFLSTSRWEGFGLSIIEAMSSGLPVISFENSGPDTILKKGKYGLLVPKYDLTTMNKCILFLTENEHNLKKYQELSLARSKDFSIEIIGKKWLRLIDDLRIK